MAPEKALVGAAGEHYVAFRLSAMGYAVGLTPRGASAVDLLVANLKTNKSITIQTKTMYEGAVKYKDGATWWKWRVGRSWEQHDAGFFYVFVDFRGDPSKSPDVFIVPSTDLVNLPKKEQEDPSLDMHPKSGPPFTDVWFVFADRGKDVYFDRWEPIKKVLS